MSIERVLSGDYPWHVVCADCIAFFESLPADSLDLVFGSPPYLDARTYGINAIYKCREWVEFMLRVTQAAVRVCKGLVLWVAAGVQRDKCYWPACEGLMWKWWESGNHLWRPAVWWKVNDYNGGTGIPGSGGKQWLRNDWEYVMCFKKESWLPWADPLVMGHPPKDKRQCGPTRRRKGEYKLSEREKMPSPPIHDADGNLERAPNGRPFPKIVNPGNVLEITEEEENESGLIVKARVGGGHLGSRLAHESEAPMPEKLAAFFIRSYCPPGGIVADCFSGSGTTLSVAVREGRRFVGCDLRQSQVELSRRRVAGETSNLFGGSS